MAETTKKPCPQPQVKKLDSPIAEAVKKKSSPPDMKIRAVRLLRGELQYRIGREPGAELLPASDFKTTPWVLRDLHHRFPDLPGPPGKLCLWERATERRNGDSKGTLPVKKTLMMKSIRKKPG